MNNYDFPLIGLANVDNVSNGGNNVDVDGSEWLNAYPSSVTVFWNDMISTIYYDI